MVGKVARAAARAVARAEAQRAAAGDRPQSPGLVGTARHHAVRLWQPVQPLATHQALQRGNALAGGVGVRALYAALQLAHPAPLGGLLGAARPRAVADLLRRDTGRGDQAGL